ncbi:MAG: ComEC/Rec2 family competence protein [Roseibacillus sp.]
MKTPTALPPLGRCPLLFPFLGAVLGILAAEYNLWPLLVALIVAGIYGGLLRQKPPFVAGAVFALLLGLVHHQRYERRAELASLLQQDQERILSGTLIETNAAGLVQRLFQTEAGARLILVDLPEHFQTGQKLFVIGTPIQPRLPRNPVGWDPQETLWKKGIAGSLAVTSAHPAGWSRGFPLMRGWSEDIRHALAQRVTSGIHHREQADVVRAVVLGEKASGSKAFEDFRKTGTMHIFAVSGLHVGLVALITYGIGRLLRLPPRLLMWITILAMVGYAFITGLRPPALRAALMGTLVLGRFLLLRRPSVVNNLFAAAIVVLSFNSFQLWQAGFQLSFLVVGTILLVEPFLWKRIAPYLDHDAYLPKPVWTPWQSLTHWSRNKVGKMFTVSLAAWSGSAPLSIAYFGWFTPIAAFASVLMVMVAFLILAIAFSSILVSSFTTTASHTLNSANGLLAQSAQHAAKEMGQWPGAWTRIQEPAAWEGGLCVFDIRFGGAAIHLDAGGGTLIDGGNRATFWWDVVPALEAHALSFDSIIASHNDASHIGGLQSAILSFPVKQALLPPEAPRYSLEKLHNTCLEKRVTLHRAAPLQVYPIDTNTHLEVLHTGNPKFGRADDRGLVLRLHQKDWRILITADAGHETERSLLESGIDLTADVWICGRNQKDSMGQDAFINAISPQVIIATDQSYPDTEQIPAAWRRWLESKGIAFYSQREHGAVFVLPKKNQLIVEGFLTNHETVLKRSHSAKPASSSPPPPTGAESQTSDQNSLPETESPPT